MLKTLVTLLLLINSLPAAANERIKPAAELLREGYRSVEPHIQGGPGDTLPSPHSLPWPTIFQDATHTIGNAMVEFQPFGEPYFHGGCDLRTQAGAELRAPVGGKLEAGHYSYATNTDGSLEKFWKPWPETGDSTYFEVAVVSSDGTRFELHHVDRDTLPAGIVRMLNSGGGTVAAGTLLGHVISWPGGDYHHTHYNIVLPSGTRINPEYASPLLADTLAPELLGLFAISERGSVDNFSNGLFASAPKEFVADVVDRQNGNIYEHPPVFVRLRFVAGAETVWDFRTILRAPNGAFPPLWDFFKASLTGPDGKTRETEGGYGTGHSLIRIPVPLGASGAFTIELGDEAGNITKRTGTIAALKAPPLQ